MVLSHHLYSDWICAAFHIRQVQHYQAQVAALLYSYSRIHLNLFGHI